MKMQVNNQTKIADDDELTITLLFNNQTGYRKSWGLSTRNCTSIFFSGA